VPNDETIDGEIVIFRNSYIQVSWCVVNRAKNIDAKPGGQTKGTRDGFYEKHGKHQQGKKVKGIDGFGWGSVG
jgi:hypothetical protein